MLFKSLALVAAATLATAQRPSNTSICDYYTTALLTNNTGANQYTLVTLLVNRAVIGNTTNTTANIVVPGILNPNGTYNGTAVNLVPYFSGALLSTNRGGANGTSVNFLDGGGAAPIAAGQPASDMSSNQYKLMTHLYQYFGGVLGCSQYGMDGYASYAGAASMYEAHKFMVIDAAETAYFITQVGLSAASFGVTEADVAVAGGALNTLFGARCAPATTVIPAQGAQLQSICTAQDCPLAANSSCANQATLAAPAAAGAAASGGGSSAAGGSMTSRMPSASGSAGAPAASSRPAGAAFKEAASIGSLVVALGLGLYALF